MIPPTPSQEHEASRVIAEKQGTIFDYLERQTIQARGETCTAEDMDRLDAACIAVYRCLLNLDKWTLKMLALSTGYTESSCSARVREIRRYLEDREKPGQKEPGPAARGTVKREKTNIRGLNTYRVELKKHFGGAAS